MTATLGPDFELQKAMAAVIIADTDCKSLFGGTVRLYQTVPDKPTLPYVTIGESQDVPDLAECIDGSELFPTLHIWSKDPSFQEAKKISATIRAALLGTTMTMTGTTLVLFERDQLGDVTLRDPDGVTFHIASHYRALTEPK